MFASMRLHHSSLLAGVGRWCVDAKVGVYIHHLRLELRDSFGKFGDWVGRFWFWTSNESADPVIGVGEPVGTKDFERAVDSSERRVVLLDKCGFGR